MKQEEYIHPNTGQPLKFPHIPKDFKISKEVLNMTVGKLPDDFDYEKERDKMWKERAMWED